MENIPKFIRWKILDYLEIEDKLKLSLLDKKYNQMINDNNYWKRLCEREFQFGEEYLSQNSNKKSNFKETYLSLYLIPFFPTKTPIEDLVMHPYKLNKISAGGSIITCACMPISKGKRYVEMKIIRSGGKAVCMGVSPYFFGLKIDTIINSVNNVYYNPYSTGVWKKDIKKTPHSVPKFKDGDIFGILVDFVETKSVYLCFNGF
eukprot:TRINITY_DN3389_c0_g1_i1.p1 TRINITY_DN3389_c0_g1~~TRINITY_DN3389_c0_g1_i1.p1  ORF type:complete len:204 (-),score=39.04 TRINITY_DN3389_c0_g1_i1:301-912(-)